MDDETNTPGQGNLMDVNEGLLENQRTLTEQLRLVRRQLPAGIIAGLILGLCGIWLLRDALPHIFLIVWYCMLLFINTYRFLVLRTVLHQDFKLNDAKRIAWIYIFFTFLSGCTWGIYVLMIPDLPETYRMIIVLMLIGMVGGIITSNAGLIFAYYGFILPVLLPLSVRTFLVGGEVWTIIGLMIIIFAVFLIITSWNLYTTLRESILIRFHKESLIIELEQAKEGLNRELDERRKVEENLQKMKNELEEAVEKLEYISTIDALTGIANRRSFDAAIAREWGRAMRSGKPIALLFIDVDYFKNYNDIYFHQAGDRVLAEVAKTIQHYSRRTGDLAARYGGEEFALILSGSDERDSRRIAEELRQSVEALEIEHSGSDVNQFLTISIGVSMIDSPISSDYSPLISKADQALYTAKHEGRNRVVFQR